MARAPDSPEANESAASGASPSADKPSAGSARTKRLVTGAAIGIGSAALVAALLYANRARRSDKS